jgi:hypothetical protein
MFGNYATETGREITHPTRSSELRSMLSEKIRSIAVGKPIFACRKERAGNSFRGSETTKSWQSIRARITQYIAITVSLLKNV